MPLLRVIKGFVKPKDLEAIIAETFAFKAVHYNDENLEKHLAYLSDAKPHRTSHAYAVSQLPLKTLLPYISLRIDDPNPFRWLADLYSEVVYQMGLNRNNRVLFNVQEYYGDSEPVPMHCDGELLDFDVREDGSLDIKRSIRPDYVAVLTLVNDTKDGGGTRVHPADAVDNFRTIHAEAGDLLIFDNVNAFHSVGALYGDVKRPDGLLRMTIGWRSLGDRCHYMHGEDIVPVSKTMAETLIGMWYVTEWPKQWEKIRAKAQKAAF